MENSLVKNIGVLLKKDDLKLAVAESCTGGLLSNWITDVPGCSEYYLGGVVAYDYKVKEKLLEVSAETLASHGAVSSETAIEMAQGVRKALSENGGLDKAIGLSLTGIAGPGGGTPEKPVGLVWIGLSTAQGDFSWSFVWQGDRTENKNSSARQALKLLKEFLEKDKTF